MSSTLVCRRAGVDVRDYVRASGRHALLHAIAALVVVSAGCSSGSGEEPPFTTVASVDEVMDSIVIPSSEAIFDAVVYSNGALVQAPMTDDDWHTIRMHALATAEAGNLLMMSPRARDQGNWLKRCREFLDAGRAAASAAKDKDVGRLLKAGGDLYLTCTACHRQYVPEAGG